MCASTHRRCVSSVQEKLGNRERESGFLGEESEGRVLDQVMKPTTMQPLSARLATRRRNARTGVAKLIAGAFSRASLVRPNDTRSSYRYGMAGLSCLSRRPRTRRRGAGYHGTDPPSVHPNTMNPQHGQLLLAQLLFISAFRRLFICVHFDSPVRFPSPPQNGSIVCPSSKQGWAMPVGPACAINNKQGKG